MMQLSVDAVGSCENSTGGGALESSRRSAAHTASISENDFPCGHARQPSQPGWRSHVCSSVAGWSPCKPKPFRCGGGAGRGDTTWAAPVPARVQRTLDFNPSSLCDLTPSVGIKHRGYPKVRRVEGSFDETERDLNTSYVIFYNVGSSCARSTCRGFHRATTRPRCPPPRLRRRGAACR